MTRTKPNSARLDPRCSLDLHSKCRSTDFASISYRLVLVAPCSLQVTTILKLVTSQSPALGPFAPS